MGDFKGNRFNDTVERLFQTAKVGAGAGWTVNAGADTFMSTCAASQAGATLVIPLNGLEVGDKVVGFHLVGQIESGGNAVDIAVALKEFKAVAAASVATTKFTGRTLTVTGDTAMSKDNTFNAIPDGSQFVVEQGKSYFALVTATTLGSTDIELLGLVLHIKKGG